MGVKLVDLLDALGVEPGRATGVDGVDTEDLAVLCALASRAPLAMHQADLEPACYLSRRTVSRRLCGLVSLGLVQRKGTRGGYLVTPRGLAVLKTIDLPGESRKILGATLAGRELLSGSGKNRGGGH
jgi:hypothetical protein